MISRPPLMAYEHADIDPCRCCRACGRPHASERHRRFHGRAEARRRGWRMRLWFWAWTATNTPGGAL